MKTKILFLLLVLFQFHTSIQAQKPVTINESHPKYDAAFLVSRAFSSISKNYPDHKNSMNTFYKERVSKNDECISVNEALLDVEKASYLSNKKDIVAIRNIRGNCNLDKRDSVMIKLQGGPLSALQLDVVKNPFLGTLAYKADESYDFSYDKPIEIDGKSFYVINFDQKETDPRMLFNGKIYIEQESLAIGKIEYSMNVEKKSFAYQNFIISKPKNKKIDITSAHYAVTYKEFDGKWYYDYSTSNICFNMMDKTDNTYDKYNVNSQMAVTNLTANNTSIDKKDKLKTTDFLSDKLKEYNLATEWDIYNLIMLIAAS